MKKLAISILLAAVFLPPWLQGCGRPGGSEGFFSRGRGSQSSGFTNVSFSNQSGEFVASSLSGGVMIYAIDLDDPSKRGSFYLESSERVWTLPNGRYRFISVGYTAANLVGNLYCGTMTDSDQAIVLDGGEATVELGMSQGRCGNSEYFFPSGNHISTYQFVSCQNLPESIGDSSNCSGGNKGALGRMRVVLPEFDGFGSNFEIVGSGIESDCLTIPDTGLPVETNLRIVSGSSISPIAVLARGFKVSNCSSNSGNQVRNYYFPRGPADVALVRALGFPNSYSGSFMLESQGSFSLFSSLTANAYHHTHFVAGSPGRNRIFLKDFD